MKKWKETLSFISKHWTQTKSILVFSHVHQDNFIQRFHFNSGMLDASELKAFVSDSTDEISEEEVEEWMKSIDKNGDGRICLNEFIQFVMESTERKRSFNLNKCKISLNGGQKKSN
jgi:hypothetical protein